MRPFSPARRPPGGRTVGGGLPAPSHVFWPEPISLLQNGLIDWRRLLGPRQITDVYLLALAVRHGGRFVTFDQRLSVAVVPAAQANHLCVIPADPGQGHAAEARS